MARYSLEEFVETTRQRDRGEGLFELESPRMLEVNLDGAGADTLTLVSAAAVALTGNAEPYALVNADTLIYRTNQAVTGAGLGPLRTINFLTADFSVIGAATAEEVAFVINRDGIGISADVTGGGTTVTIRSDAQGTGASLVIDAGGTGSHLYRGWAGLPAAG